MNPEMEKPRITEIKVRMDCNGCVQKIKKALHGITGIYDIYVDFPQQKLTIIGWADPEKIVKAIKKTRKTAVICSHSEQSDHQPTTEPSPEAQPPTEGGAPPPETNTQPLEEPPTEIAPPTNEPPDNQPASPPPESKPPNDQSANNESSSQSTQHIKPKDHEEIHVIYHHPPEYGRRYAYGPYHHGRGGDAAYLSGGSGYREMPPQPVFGGGVADPGGGPGYREMPPQSVPGSGVAYPGGGPGYREMPPQPVPGGGVAYPGGGPGYREIPPQPVPGGGVAYPGAGPGHREMPPQPVYVTHSYNTYNPSAYVTEYAYPYSQPGNAYYSRQDHYSRPDQYSQVYYSGSNGNGNGSGNGNITSIFSEENPNACTVV